MINEQIWKFPEKTLLRRSVQTEKLQLVKKYSGGN